jgi:hypothetical protein
MFECVQIPENAVWSAFDRVGFRSVLSNARRREGLPAMARDPDSRDRSPAGQSDAERYRAAAEATLDQLDWCIAYLHRIRKSTIAAALARNQSEIRRRLT